MKTATNVFKNVFKISAPLALLLLGSSAFANHYGCESASGQQGYRSGNVAATRSLDVLWTNFMHSDCLNLESFTDAVQFEPTRNLLSDQDYLRCRDRGFIEGQFRFVDQTTQHCVDLGIDGGGAAGVNAGKTICAVYIGVMQQRCAAGAIPLFPSIVEGACRGSARGYIQDHCPGALQNPDLMDSLDLTCKQ